MPAPARAILGLAPRQYPASTGTVTARLIQRPAVVIPPQDAYQGEGPSSVPGPLTVDLPGGEEDPVRRRTFVSLTGASLFGAVLASTGLADRPIASRRSPRYWPDIRQMPPPGDPTR